MDYQNDSNPKPLYRIDELVGTPEYVSTAEVITKEATSHLADIAFADPRRREFPCFNKVSAYLSFAYLKGAGITNPKVEAIIKEAATMFGIQADIAKIEAALATVKSAAVSPPLFALPPGTTKYAGTAFYPISNREEVEASAHQLLNDQERLTAGLFHKAAQAVVKAASAFPGCVLPAKVARAGVPRYPDIENAKQIAGNRRFEVKQADALELYQDIVKLAEAGTEPQQVAEMWEELDQKFGVKYANGIVDPWTAVFSGTPVAELEKLAQEIVIIHNTPVPMQVVSGISDESLSQRFTKATATKLAEWKKQATAALRSEGIATFSPEIQKEVLRLALAV